MDDKVRSNDTNDSEDSPQKTSRRRRTPSADPTERVDVKSKRRSRSNSRSRSPSRDRGNRRRRSRSRVNYSPDRRGRFGRGAYQRDNFYNRRRRSPSRSPGYRGGRNRNARRSRSSSFDRYRNRRNTSTSRERSMSQGRGENNRSAQQQQPTAPPPPQVSATNYQNDYAPTPFQPEYQVAQPPYQNPTQFGNYDYVPMMQPPPTSFPAYPPPPSQDYMWNAQVPPPPIISCAPAATDVISASIKSSATDEEEQKRQAAIAAEKKIQRDTIRKQRDGYIRRASALKRELVTLKEQRQELITGNDPPSPTTNGFIKENDKLQIQIENKIGTIENVIEMLNGILSADKSDTDSPKKTKSAPKQEEANNSDDSSPERLKTKVIESLSRKRKESERNRRDENTSKSAAASAPLEQINYTFFDPEQHWCKACSAFPKTAKEYLLHLHTEEHKANVKPPEIPWHDHLVKDDMPVYANAPTKRTPIRGLQFFVPSTAWYCKLCSIWIGDLHCASSHLKSQTHAKEYDKFTAKNQMFENEWLDERQKALDANPRKGVEQSQKVIAPPSPPVISSQNEKIYSQKQMASHAPPPPQITTFVNASDRLFDGIPLQINQRSKDVKEVTANEEVEKKKGSKKKKKEKKKRKKSKKKHRHSSSSSSSSSEESSASRSPERKTSIEQTIDSTTSIRVAMRNAVPARGLLKPKSDDDEPQDVGGWTVVQPEARAIPPKPPTISANGEEQNRRDEAMLSQWTPLPVISEKEKLMFEQLKGKIKDRDEKKKEKISPVTTTTTTGTVQNAVQSQTIPPQKPGRESSDRSSKTSDKRRDESEHGFKEVREKDRREAYRKRRSRSTSSPRRDRDRDRRSRSPRRDRRRRSRSPSPRRDRRYSRSPRRDRRRDRYSRSRSRSKDRYADKKDVKDKNAKTSADKPPSKKPATAAVNTGKKLPFIGRMPVFKKQTTEDDSKKPDPANQAAEEANLIEKKKKEELKFQIQQKQQLLQMHQKQAEAYNLAHPGQFANIYNTHGTIHHILPTVQPEEYDLMPDPMQYELIQSNMQYATLMTTAAPPPPMAPPQEPKLPHFEEPDEPVLPPGIDVEEAENMELEAVVPPPPRPSNKDNLPKDFQDALSIIFDKGVDNSSGETVTDAAATAVAISSSDENPTEITNVVMQDNTSNYTQMDLSSMDTQPSHIEQPDLSNGATNMELDDSSHYIYAEEHFIQNHIQQTVVEPQHATDLATQNIPTPPIQILDAAGNLTKIPGPVLEVGSDFVVLDPDGNRINKMGYSVAPDENKIGSGQIETEHDIEMKLKRQQELDDLAMLGIDADDLAAQCI